MHLITLSFDDGFKKSCVKIAEVYERFGLSACFNVIATGHRPHFKAPDSYQDHLERGDFIFWNELQDRGHEIMPHGYLHANKSKISFSKSKSLILRCLDVFLKELKGFDPKKAVFNFPYNASTPELENWLPTVVRAFRAKGRVINPMPHPKLIKLTCSGYGPGNCEKYLDHYIKTLLSKPKGWLIYNTHGLDDEGWGPIRRSYLERLLDRLVKIKSVRVIPAAKALDLYE